MTSIYLILVYILAYIGLVATSFYIINLVTYYRKGKDAPEADDKSVTIIIPAFNEGQSIARTIESVKSLDYPKDKLEIIVIDDGSKDKTYEIAKKFERAEGPKIVVFTKRNGGKGSALNLGISKSKGEIIVSMDADTFVRPDSLRKMIGYFRDENVWCVAPSMGILNPKGILGRIVQIEYYMGVFLRKSFATVNAIHVTPGAFSAYRKSFFDKYGGYEEDNLTEDLELALRIQSKHGIIENAPEAAAYTLSPQDFKSLLYQRRRWYVGLVRNLWAYRRLFGLKHGALGSIVLPVAVSTVVLSVILTVYVVIRVLLEIKEELIFLSAVNFEFSNVLELNSFLIERFLLNIFSRPVFIIGLLFIALVGFYVFFSRKKMMYKEKTKLNFILFALFYSFLFAFWWIVSFVYLIFNREVKWREEVNEKKGS